MRDITQPHRNARIGGREGNFAKVLHSLKVARGAHHVFGLGELEHRSAGLLVGLAYGIDDLLLRDVECAQPIRIEHDLVLPHHAAEGGHLRDVRDRLQLILQEPVLHGAQLRQIVSPASVDERVLVNPADSGRIWPQRGLRGGGKARLHLVQVLEDA